MDFGAREALFADEEMREVCWATSLGIAVF